MSHKNKKEKISIISEPEEDLRNADIIAHNISNETNEINILTEKQKINDKEIKKIKKENQNSQNKKIKKGIKKENKDFYYNDDNEICLKNNKKQYEKNFIELKEKCNLFYQEIEQQKKIIENYQNYLDEINQQMKSYSEKLSISDSNLNINESNKKINKLNTLKVSDSISQLNEIYINQKNIFSEDVENLLKEISNYMIIINKKKYKNENNLKKIEKNIKDKEDEINNICNILEEMKNNFNEENYKDKKKVNKLKEIYDNINKMPKNKKLLEESNRMNVDELMINLNPNINNYIDNNLENISLKDSFLIKVENIKDKLDIYKSKTLFMDKEDKDSFIHEKQILRKNWNETCYVYDDYDEYDIYYDIKAVGLDKNQFFTTCMHSFLCKSKVEILSFLINDVNSKYIFRNNCIEFKIKLYNLQSSKIHIKYKQVKKLAKGEIELRKIYREDVYGLDKSLEGQIAKFKLINKGTFVIINFDKYFLIRNENNLNEIEYIWGGRVPKGGCLTNIMFSKKEAVWSFNISTTVWSDCNIKNTIFTVPIEFMGGNNEIIKINPSSLHTSNITLDEENKQYIIKYTNTKSKEVDFNVEGKFKNKCKGEWVVDINDNQVEENIPEDVVLCKSQLYSIAKKIIENFDKTHKDSDFKFLDYMKIGMWVNENVKYDLRYIEKTDYTAIDIYKKRRGVCHHFTKLSNALLYSLGYKVIFVYGYYCQNNKEFNQNSAHSWSLIKIGNKWYPFDSTWGIFSGKLPVGHIFGIFYDKVRETDGTDLVGIDDEIIYGKYLS